MTDPILFTRNESYSKTFFGFWIYLLTDCILFGSLFASYVVLRKNTYGAPSAQDLFDLSHALGETIVLLTSSLFAGFARIEAFRNRPRRAIALYLIAFLLGALFLALTWGESAGLISRGYSWRTSAFLSAFFTVVWSHAFHILAGLIWMAVLLIQLWSRGITLHTFKRISCFTLFWQFLSFIWIFTFTIVYLMGVANL